MPLNPVQSPVALGICGLGGFSGVIRRQALAHMQESDRHITLAAACDPDLARFAQFADDVRAVGGKVYGSLDEMLASPLEAVWLPVPIDLHRPFTEKALAAGKVVMCEKPAAGIVDDVDAMIAARDRAGIPAVVAFQDTYKPATLALKRKILDGEIGAVKSVTVMGAWTRDTVYYGRNTWAGRLKRGDSWVLDSPAVNAFAHYINLALFFLGEDVYTWATPDSVEAELYRAMPIENYDTCSLRLWVRGIPVLVLFTHACARQPDSVLQITGTRGQINRPRGDLAELINEAGTQQFAYETSHRSPFERLANLVRCIPDERALATLEGARAHTVSVNGANEASPVFDVPREFVHPHEGREVGSVVRAIDGIEDLFVACAESGQMLHESKLASWTLPAGKKDLRGYDHFSAKMPAALQPAVGPFVR